MESYPKIRISDGRVYLLLATGGEENENVFICITEPSPAHRRGQGARNRCLTVYERCRAKDPKASFRIWSEELETNNLSAVGTANRYIAQYIQRTVLCVFSVFTGML